MYLWMWMPTVTVSKQRREGLVEVRTKSSRVQRLVKMAVGKRRRILTVNEAKSKGREIENESEPISKDWVRHQYQHQHRRAVRSRALVPAPVPAPARRILDRVLIRHRRMPTTSRTLISKKSCRCHN